MLGAGHGVKGLTGNTKFRCPALYHHGFLHSSGDPQRMSSVGPAGHVLCGIRSPPWWSWQRALRRPLLPGTPAQHPRSNPRRGRPQKGHLDGTVAGEPHAEAWDPLRAGPAPLGPSPRGFGGLGCTDPLDGGTPKPAPSHRLWGYNHLRDIPILGGVHFRPGGGGHLCPCPGQAWAPH